MYADDLIVLSASVVGLQKCLNTLYDISQVLCLDFNSKKSVCIAFGQRHQGIITPLRLGPQHIEWCSSVKYLGVVLRAGSELIVDTSAVSRKFYAAANSILNCKTAGLDDLSRLHLLESYCLPVLTCAVAALKLSKAQCKALNVCWNNVYRRVFKFHKWESVKCFDVVEVN